MLARGLLGALPELVPPEVLPLLRRAMAIRTASGSGKRKRRAHHTDMLVMNFVMNAALPSETRQTAALCLLLVVPEVWALNGSHVPGKLLPLGGGGGINGGGGGSISFVSAAAAGAGAGATASAATSTAGVGVGVGSSSAAAPEFAPGVAAGVGVGESREMQDLLRKQAEVRA